GRKIANSVTNSRRPGPDRSLSPRGASGRKRQGEWKRADDSGQNRARLFPSTPRRSSRVWLATAAAPASPVRSTGQRQRRAESAQKTPAAHALGQEADAPR